MLNCVTPHLKLLEKVHFLLLSYIFSTHLNINYKKAEKVFTFSFLNVVAIVGGSLLSDPHSVECLITCTLSYLQASFFRCYLCCFLVGASFETSFQIILSIADIFPILTL